MSLVLLALYAASFAMAAEPQLLATLGVSDSRFTAFAFGPDGEILATGSADGGVKIWNVKTGKFTVAVAGIDSDHYDHSVNCIAFTADGKILAACELEAIRLCDVATGKKLLQIDTIGPRSVTFSRDGKTLLTGHFGVDGVRLWDAATGTLQKTFKGCACTNSVALSPDGTSMASIRVNGRISVWDTKTGAPVTHCGEVAQEFPTIEYSSDGKTLIRSGEGNFQLWDVAKGNKIVEFSDPEFNVMGAARIVLAAKLGVPNSKTMSSAQAKGEIVTHDLATGKVLDTFKDKKRYTAAAYNSDGKLLAVGTQSDNSTFAIKIFKVSN